MNENAGSNLWCGQQCSGMTMRVVCMPYYCMPLLHSAPPLLVSMSWTALPCGQVKLRKAQLQMLASAEGAAAARFAKQLVTIVTDLKHPPVW